MTEKGWKAMRHRGFRAVFAATLGLPLLAAGALAQQAERSPQAIEACLCMERSVAALNAQVQAQSRAYEKGTGDTRWKVPGTLDWSHEER